MLTEHSKLVTQGTYLNFIDEGYLNPKAQTKRFSVTEKSGSKLGEIRWFAPWRKYCFFTNNVVLEEVCMADISEFLKAKTAAQKATWKS